MPGADRRGSAQAALDPERLVFLDETCAATDMARTRGRCPVGERLDAAVPFGHWEATTFTAARRVGGRSTGRPVRRLRPTACPPCGPATPWWRTTWRATSGLRLLPPYRPDLNPIERAFSKSEALLREAARRAVEELRAYLGEVLDEFKRQECRNDFASRGYPAATPTREPL